ncbi:hypothetical protein UPYG_G00061380 [Umbra pygmaea]|uniref:MYCBP-associated protein n=1 Tax=Umbra pygmaea TaxID=75934 RepID=A0ABD0XWV7_UMBPY
MASVKKLAAKISKKEATQRTPSEEPLKVCEELLSCVSESASITEEDIQALAIRPEDLEKLRVPQPPKEPQKLSAVTQVLVRKTRPPDDIRKLVTVAVARPLDNTAQPLDYTEPGGPRFDAQGMILPHSILGSMEDFRIEMQARGEAELVRRVPAPQRLVTPPLSGGWSQRGAETSPVLPRGQRDAQSHALQHWNTHMMDRRHQQDLISSLLQKPAERLLMNQSSRFREVHEQRELISRALPAMYPGQGYRVGSEYWSLPKRFGDELSGITATLTRKERGQLEPVTHIGQPRSIRKETGLVSPEQAGSTSRTWDQSLYLQDIRHELRDVLKDLDFNQPEIDGLEVIGSGILPTSWRRIRKRISIGQKENNDPLAQFDDVILDTLLVPALIFCGQPARWTGNSTSHKGQVGISARMTFEALSGERASSTLELRNEGSTAVYYSWQRLPQPHSFADARTHTPMHYFYFNHFAGVVLPGSSQCVEFIFKSDVPGIRTEVWRFNTHPVLLGGASIQVTLRGVAIYQDKTAHQRQALERELQRKVAVSMCQSLVGDVLRGVRTPERPSSPAELYATEEELFHRWNPKLQYHYETVRAMKRLWQEVNTEAGENEGTEWDLSLSTLRQAVLSLPQGDRDQDSPQQKLSREGALSQYNSLALELSQPLVQHTPLPVITLGLQLWRELLDSLVSEALWLRHTLGLPETDTWEGYTHQPDDNWSKMKKEEKKTGASPKEEKKGGSAKEKEKGAARPPVKDKGCEERPGSKKKGRDDVGGKRPTGKPGSDLSKEASTAAASPEQDYPNPPSDSVVQPGVQDKYRRQLHQQVYVLMGGLVDSLCGLMDEEGDGQNCYTHL